MRNATRMRRRGPAGKSRHREVEAPPKEMDRANRRLERSAIGKNGDCLRAEDGGREQRGDGEREDGTCFHPTVTDPNGTKLRRVWDAFFQYPGGIAEISRGSSEATTPGLGTMKVRPRSNGVGKQ